MDEWTRLLVIVAVALVAVGGAALLRRAGTAAKTPLPPELAPFPAVIFFGSETCLSCRPTLVALREAGIAFRQYTWEQDAELFERLEIEEVPLLWAVDRRGRVRTEIRGVPDQRQLSLPELHVSAK